MAEGSEASSGLPSEVSTFTSMIADLEEQMDRLIATNDALGKDLAGERKRRTELEQQVEELQDRLRRNERDADARENLQAEINHLTQERSKLTATVRDLKQKEADAETEHRRQQGVIERARAAREDALDDVKTVEAQFERSMRLLADTRAQLTVLREQRTALEARIKLHEEEVARVKAERDALADEVDQSRDALDEVRRALADACASSNDVLKGAAARGSDESAA